MNGPLHLVPRTALAALDRDFEVAGMTCVADPSGALWLPDMRVLVVADLHFEKGSAFARRGVFLPPYDTATTLARLALVIATYQPRQVVALGDSFHDGDAPARLSAANTERLVDLQHGRNWIWIAGNHDVAAPQHLPGEACEAFQLGALTLRHQPQTGAAFGEIAGHLHPVARVGRGPIVRRRCFASDGQRCILPAFGAYAGGLNVLDGAFTGLFGANMRVHVLGKARIYTLARVSCLPEPRAGVR